MASFNIEDVNQVKKGVEMVKEAIEVAKSGLANCGELAEAVNADKYTRTTNSFVEKGNESLKSMEDFVEVGEALVAHYERLDAGLN